MRFNKHVRLTAVLSLVIAMPIFVVAESDDDKAGSVGFKFLNLQYGARGAALGGLPAQASGAEASFWNPAGLASANGIEITANMTQWIVETNYLNAGVALPFAGGVVGLSIISVDYGDIMKSGWSGETEFVFEPNQAAFEASDAAIQFSYAKYLSEKFSIGGTVKMLTEKIDTETISGFAFDLGTQFNTGFQNIRLGAVISNFGPDISPIRDNVPDISLPMTFMFGIIGQAFGDENMGLVAGVNVLKYADMVQRFAFSGEYTVAGMAKLRGSYTLGYDQAPLSVGAGVNMKGVTADIGITVMADFDMVTRISFGYVF
ncbi:MAG: PorV/PorQ family protein [Candidatus Marinimicrobia bacterium]|nr:PorV/PorQ family protein [Candidatus Neomarinimicrobiota bacterium]